MLEKEEMAPSFYGALHAVWAIVSQEEKVPTYRGGMDGWEEAGSSGLVFSCRRFIASRVCTIRTAGKKGQAHSLTSYRLRSTHKIRGGRFLHGNILYNLSFIFFKQ